MAADAYLRGHPLPRLVSAAVAPARAPLAFATIRATFEDGAFTERAFRARPTGSALAGRERAQAQRLAYGAVQRRGTSDAAIERLPGARPGCSTRRCWRAAPRPLRAALRRRDPRPRRRRPGGRAGQERPAPPTPPASSTRSCAAPPASATQLTAALLGDDSTPERAAVAHSAPHWLARDVVGGAGRRGRPLAARRLQRAGRGGDAGQRPAHRPRGDARADAARGRGGGERAPEATWPLAAPEIDRDRRPHRRGGAGAWSRPAS